MEYKSLPMSLDTITIPGGIVKVQGTRKQTNEIFVFAISTCMWCKRGKQWLKDRGYQYSYLDIDKIPVEEKNKLKEEIKEVFGVHPRFPFVVVDKTQWNAGYNPNQWEEMLE